MVDIQAGSRLSELRIVVAPSEEGGVDHPLVNLLVDGADILADGGMRIGFGAEEMLGADSPLLPVDPPRRVALYLCNCGEPGCGVAAPLVSEERGVIQWLDFRDYVGVFVDPVVMDFALGDGKELPIRDVSFDAAAYRREVERAVADRSWETEARRTARLLGLDVRAARTELLGMGFEPAWSAIEWDDRSRFVVCLWRGDEQYVVSLAPPASGTPEERAAEMTRSLLLALPRGLEPDATEPDRWRLRDVQA